MQPGAARIDFLVFLRYPLSSADPFLVRSLNMQSADNFQSNFLVDVSWSDSELRISGASHGCFGWKTSALNGADADGIYVQWNLFNDVLVLENDRLGMFPLFYAQLPCRFIFSDSLQELTKVAGERELDACALNAFLHLGFFLEDDTPLRGIQTLKPNSRISISTAGVSFESRSLAPMERSSLSDCELRSSFRELFSDSLKSCLAELPPEKQIILPLSGGKDSRHIFLELLAQKAKLACAVTAEGMPWIHYRDTEIAAKLCERASVVHAILEQPVPSLETFESNCDVTQMCADEHAWYAVVANFLLKKQAAIFDGLGGDVLAGGLFLTEKRVQLIERQDMLALAEDIVPNYQPISLFRAEFGEMRDRKSLVERIEATLMKYSNFVNPVGMFFLFSRTRREIALSPCCYLNRLSHVHMPFLHEDVFRLLLSVPLRLLLNGQFHKRTIRESYPKYAEIDFSEIKGGYGSVAKSRRASYRVSGHLLRTLLTRPRYISRRWLVPRMLRLAVDRRYTAEGMNVAQSAVHLQKLSNLTSLSK